MRIVCTDSNSKNAIKPQTSDSLFLLTVWRPGATSEIHSDLDPDAYSDDNASPSIQFKSFSSLCGPSCGRGVGAVSDRVGSIKQIYQITITLRVRARLAPVPKTRLGSARITLTNSRNMRRSRFQKDSLYPHTISLSSPFLLSCQASLRWPLL